MTSMKNTAVKTRWGFVGFRWLCLACALGLVTLAGCGKGSAKLVPVTGKVTVGNKPLPGGGVTFWPDGKAVTADAPAPIGTVDTDGNYKLTTAGKPGAPLGKYKVTVSSGTATGEAADPMKSVSGVPGKGPAAPLKLNPKYEDKTATDLSVEVVDKPAAGAYDLNLK